MPLPKIDSQMFKTRQARFVSQIVFDPWSTFSHLWTIFGEISEEYASKNPNWTAKRPEKNSFNH